MNLSSLLLEVQSSAFNTIWHDYLKIICLVLMFICAVFIILVVLFQPGNSTGVSALGGTTETFLGKNKSKTFEHKMKKLTIVSSIILALLCILFAVIGAIFPA